LCIFLSSIYLSIYLFIHFHTRVWV
jgi:hypothetical protein